MLQLARTSYYGCVVGNSIHRELYMQISSEGLQLAATLLNATQLVHI